MAMHNKKMQWKNLLHSRGTQQIGDYQGKKIMMMRLCIPHHTHVQQIDTKGKKDTRP